MLKRFFIALTSPIWAPVLAIVTVCVALIVIIIWPFYWIITGKDIFKQITEIR